MQKNDGLSFVEFWRSSASEMKKVASIAGGGMLAALGIAVKTLYIPIGQLLKISFSFLATGLSGYLYGPLVAGFAGAVVDVATYLIRPDGAYFFGFTLSAFLEGVIYGLWFYRRPLKLWRVLGACFTAAVVVSLILNPIWLYMLLGTPYWAQLPLRLLKNGLLLPIHTFLLYTLLKVTSRARQRLVQN